MERAVEALRQLSGSGLLDEITMSVKKRTMPNIFRVFPRVLRAESLHSDVLRWLLDPSGFHGLEDAFSVGFLRRLLQGSHEGRVPDGLKWDEHVAVSGAVTEVPTGRGPIDILVHGPWGGRPFVMGVENKVGSSEGRKGEGKQRLGQLRRYADALCHLYPQSTVIVALLTPDGRPPGLDHHSSLRARSKPLRIQTLVAERARWERVSGNV